MRNGKRWDNSAGIYLNVLAQRRKEPRADEPQPKEFSPVCVLRTGRHRGAENAEKRRGKISACLRATHRQAPERRGYSVSLAN